MCKITPNYRGIGHLDSVTRRGSLQTLSFELLPEDLLHGGPDDDACGVQSPTKGNGRGQEGRRAADQKNFGVGQGSCEELEVCLFYFYLQNKFLFTK